MRQMAHGCEHLVVLLRSQFAYIRTAPFPGFAYQSHGLFRVFRERREYDSLALVQISLGCSGTALLRARDRMCRNELCNPAPEIRTRSGHHITLGAATVGNQRVGA